MEFQDISKASSKFRIKLIDFINDYLKKYPTYDIIRERHDQGELLCIDYRTLEISTRNESELEPEKSFWLWSQYKNVYTFNMMLCTADDCNSKKSRIPNYQDIEEIALTVVEAFVNYNNIKDYWSLPSYLLPTAEEIAEEKERERKYREEQELKRIEKERIRAEHAFQPDATPVMLLIPDIHGRTFWKRAVETYPSLPVIFLGDYLDPYHNSIENISAAEALSNFKEILQYKQEHEQVTLLLGNHDLHYLFDDIDCSRKDEINEDEIRSLFINSMDLFQLALSLKITDKTFVFSHAGILPGWLDLRFSDMDKSDAEGICTILNSKLHSDPSFIRTLASDASYHRWGPTKFGSPVWADIAEHEENEPYSTKKKDYPFALSDDVFQVFGHTQQKEDPLYRPYFSCLDCRRAFLLTSEGKITELYQTPHKSQDYD